ncbi:GAF domain-containing sensor histidine kinase [Inmirania thermothiophila]|uniref:histidine kinase n=1 Tax=Inmirania thermothiophila TaxID=1750597 RepID=A0A3N1XZZ7_9GAMM|nr:GAF domain-containing protein [Inmirania thermothiophila]ROR32163.1 two-component system nitrate/nitrite sensor histidine kinase NarX [Inmirania thermothiophila]
MAGRRRIGDRGDAAAAALAAAVVNSGPGPTCAPAAGRIAMAAIGEDAHHRHPTQAARPGRPGVAAFLLREGLLLPFLLLAALLGALLIATLATGAGPWIPALAGAALALLAYLGHRAHARLARSLGEVAAWAARVRAGDLGARMAGDSPLAAEINAIGEDLERVSRAVDEEICRHTDTLAQKTRSLQVLYDVAASINASRDLDDLLGRFLDTLIRVVRARAATVRLRGEDGTLRLVASRGLDPELEERERHVDVRNCLCGAAAADGALLCRTDLQACEQALAGPLLGGEQATLVVVPLHYRGRTLGIYNLFVDRPGFRLDDDERELLTSIGRHLGMAIEKARLDEKARRFSVMRERTMLAHELHDSLAQTLASLRYQVRMLAEMMEQGDATAGRRELERIRNGLDEAHTELRELLVHFRAPLDDRGLLPAIEETVERFRRETGIATFLQKECGAARLPALYELQVLRIVQEALANIRKHSRAHAVRILMRCRDGEYHVLVEDDGVGFEGRHLEGRPGEHVGLSIMQERARRLGGELRIESEPGEGTRVDLRFRDPGEVVPEPVRIQ